MKNMTENYERYEEISRFLDGSMSADQRRRFTRELTDSNELQEEVAFFRQLRLALEIDRVPEEAVSSDDIVAYATDPDSLDDETRNRMDRSLANDPQLRDMIETSRHAVESAERVSAQQTAGDGSTLLQRVWRFLFPPAVAVRAAISYVAILAVMFIGISGVWNGERGTIQSVSLSASQDLRGAGDDNLIMLRPSAELIEIAFAFPASSEFSYNYALLASDSTVMLAWPDQRAQTYDTLLVPARQLSVGEVLLRIEEVDRDGVVVDEFLYPITVRRAQE